MEEKLKRLFDFQKFEQNADLQSVIDSVHSRYRRQALSLDDVDLVSAAGSAEAYTNPLEEKKKGQ